MNREDLPSEFMIQAKDLYDRMSLFGAELTQNEYVLGAALAAFLRIERKKPNP